LSTHVRTSPFDRQATGRLFTVVGFRPRSAALNGSKLGLGFPEVPNAWYTPKLAPPTYSPPLRERAAQSWTDDSGATAIGFRSLTSCCPPCQQFGSVDISTLQPSVATISSTKRAVCEALRLLSRPLHVRIGRGLPLLLVLYIDRYISLVTRNVIPCACVPMNTAAFTQRAWLWPSIASRQTCKPAGSRFRKLDPSMQAATTCTIQTLFV
jgi:hypothetical protein